MKLALADALAMVRAELIKANDAAMATGRPVMLFDECELEFAVELEVDVKAKTSYFTFVSLSGGAKKSDMNTIKIKFKSLEKTGIVAAGGDRSKPGPAAGKRLKRGGR